MEDKRTEPKPLQWLTTHGWIMVALLVSIPLGIVIYWAIWADISPSWTGFGTYDETTLGPRAKTLWDWMELLIVPIVLAIAGFWFSRSQKKTELEIAEKARAEDRKIAEEARQLDREIAKEERDADRQIALERQRQQTLENYLDRMKELILDRGLGPNAPPEVMRLARTLTLNVLRELESERNRQVIQFLQESELLGENGVVELAKANLSHLQLKRSDLQRSHLRGANLHKTNLQRANLQWANLQEANLQQANLQEANLQEANLQQANLQDIILESANMQLADLQHASLQGANMQGANMQRANMQRADLSKVDLREADLQGADLQGANLPGANLLEANLSNADLQKTNLHGTNLQEANLQEADLRFANLRWANLHGANLQGIKHNKGTIWPEGFNPLIVDDELLESPTSDDNVNSQQ